MVLTVSFALSPVIGLSCHRHRRDAKASSPTRRRRRGVRTTRLRRRLWRHSSRAPPRPPHPAPTSVTIAKRPSCGTGWREIWMWFGGNAKRNTSWKRTGLGKSDWSGPI